MDEPNVVVMWYEALSRRLLVSTTMSEDLASKIAERWPHDIYFFAHIEEI